MQGRVETCMAHVTWKTLPERLAGLSRGETVAMTNQAPRPIAAVNPADDTAFRGVVQALIDAGVSDPTSLQEKLRELYPSAVVRPRDLSGERKDSWYVYRDGRWTC